MNWRHISGKALPGTRRGLYIYSLVFFLFAMMAPGMAEACCSPAPVLLQDGQEIDGRWISDGGELLLDPTRQMTLAEARQATNWLSLTNAISKRGITADRAWMRQDIHNQGDMPRRVYISYVEQFYRHFDLYAVDASGNVIKTQKLSARADVDEWPVRDAPLIGYVDLSPGQSMTVYMMAEHNHLIPMNAMARLWTADSYAQYSRARLQEDTGMAVALFMVAVIVMIFGLYTRRQRLFYFAGLMLTSCWTFLFVIGNGRSLLPFTLPEFLEPGFHVSFHLAGLMIVEFGRRHMELATIAPRLARLYKGMAIYFLLAIIFSLLNIDKFVEVLVTLLSIFWFAVILMPVAVHIAWKQRTSAMIWYALGMASFAMVVLGSALTTLVTAGLEGVVYTAFIRSTFIVQLLEVVFFVMSLASWMRGQEQARIEAEATSMRDPLTGLLNRRGYDRRMQSLLREAHPGCLWVAAIDIDHFKAINDRWTHDGGDMVLKSIARQLSSAVRDQDIVARFGGEEFVMVIEAHDEEMARSICERLRQTVETHATRYGNARIAHTISIGLAQLKEHQLTGLRTVMLAADTALYAAKNGGRNQLCLA